MQRTAELILKRNISELEKNIVLLHENKVHIPFIIAAHNLYELVPWYASHKFDLMKLINMAAMYGSITTLVNALAENQYILFEKSDIHPLYSAIICGQLESCKVLIEVARVTNEDAFFDWFNMYDMVAVATEYNYPNIKEYLSEQLLS